MRCQCAGPAVVPLVRERAVQEDRRTMNDKAFELCRPAAPAAGGIIFLCDHASNALPARYGMLGLDAAAIATHIAYDIGAADVTKALAKAYGAPAVLARYSRLLIDLNRGEDDPTLVMKLSDGRIIPGNCNAGPEEIETRLREYHSPYHEAVEREIVAARDGSWVPVLISIHSFTPVWNDKARPWQVGVLWDRDSRLARPLLDALTKVGFTTGDNEPYSGALENDCLYRHGTMNGLPHVLIELRQDLVATPEDARKIASRLKSALDLALAAMSTHEIRFTRPFTAFEGETPMNRTIRIELEAAVFRRLVAHLRERTDVQNIDMMITAGFCRNCLGDWYREAAAEKGMTLAKNEARELVYGISPAEWKARYQKDATPEQQAAFEKAQSARR